jgi:hypothetical protein
VEPRLPSGFRDDQAGLHDQLAQGTIHLDLDDAVRRIRIGSDAQLAANGPLVLGIAGKERPGGSK